MAPRSPLVVASAWLGLLAACPDSQAVEPGAADAATRDRDATPPALDAAPARVCDPRDFGAAGDGARKDTAAIQAAIDACATTGGTVRLAGGVFLSGTIRLASGVTLEVCPTSTRLLIPSAVDALVTAHRAAPLVALQRAGVRCVLGSDDPEPLATSYQRERAIATEAGVDLVKLDADARARWTALVAAA